MFNILRTRKGKLLSKLELELEKESPDISKIIKIIDDYESDNLATINKLRRKKSMEVKKINGALKQAIHAHGPITKELIGSAGKRVYGALLDKNKPTQSLITKFLNFFK